MGLGNQDHLRPAPIGKGRFLNATSQRSSDFVLGKIRTEGAIGVWEPAADIALKTGTARYDLWQPDRRGAPNTHHGTRHRTEDRCGSVRFVAARSVVSPKHPPDHQYLRA